MYVLLSDIEIDKRIYEYIKSKGYVFPSYLEGNVVEMKTFTLADWKLASIQEATVELPAISVSRSAYSGKYLVINGRHRLCFAIMSDKIDINCAIVDM